MKHYFMHCFDMKMWRPFVVLALLGSILTACSDSTDDPDVPGSGQEKSAGDDASDKVPFKVMQTVVNNNGESTQTVALRYYEDMPNVAYISVSDFQYMLMPSKTIQVSRTAASQYKLVTSKGETATVNTAEESMTFDDFMSFVAVYTLNNEGYMEDVNPFYVKAKPATLSPAAASVTFNMKKYGIDLRGDGQMVYVPLTTLSNIYSSNDGNHVMFNGEKILLTNFDTKPALIDKPFLLKPYETTERPADLASYSYGELCFAIDHFYGRPGRNSIDNIIQEKGIEQVISEKHRKLLKSTKMNEYIFGMEWLAMLLDDGGHTHLSPISSCSYVGMDDPFMLAAYLKKFVSAFSAAYPKEASAVQAYINKDDGVSIAAKERQKRLNPQNFAKIGNSIYYAFDDFGPIDIKSWKAFYEGTGPMPKYDADFKGDICGIVEALDTAASDPDVKNFVLDLTCNNGGDAAVLVTITNLLAGKNSFTFENTLTKQLATQVFSIDANFDRVFDEKDKAPRHPQLNIAIMTSHYAFSCGNLLPSLMKDYGYLIIGEKTGGGSCSIQNMCTAEGFCYILSSARMRLLNQAGENIDGGVEPHISLEVKKAMGKDDYGENVEYSDFSAFYDPSIGDQIVNWYANKK